MVTGFLVDFSTKNFVINTKDKANKRVISFSPFYLEKGALKMEGLTLTSTMFEGLISAITSNLGVLIPVGLTIFGIMVAVSLIPRIIYKFL